MLGVSSPSAKACAVSSALLTWRFHPLRKQVSRFTCLSRRTHRGGESDAVRRSGSVVEGKSRAVVGAVQRWPRQRSFAVGGGRRGDRRVVVVGQMPATARRRRRRPVALRSTGNNRHRRRPRRVYYSAKRYNAGNKAHRCKKKRFFTFLSRACFFTFFNVFYFANVFYFKNVHWKYHVKSLSKQRKQIITASFPSIYTSRHASESSSSSSKNWFRWHNVNHLAYLPLGHLCHALPFAKS